MTTTDEWRTTCITACDDKDGRLLALIVMDNGEGFYSYIFRITNLDTGERETVYEVSTWLTSMWRAPGGAVFAVDADGLVHSNETGTFVTTDTDARPGLTRVWGIDDERVFACGQKGVVVRKAGTRWQHFDDGVDGDLYGLHGAGADDLYVVGEEGRIFHYDGSRWTRIDAPTNFMLNAVFSRTRDLIYLCGNKGQMFAGAGSRWRALNAPKVNLFSIAEFQSRMYVAAGGKGVFLVEGEDLREFKTGIASHKLVGSPNFLYSAGGHFADYFDGTEWWGNEFA